jgi:hypothetical protein
MQFIRRYVTGFACVLFLIGFIQAKMIEYVEDVYLMQAPAPLVALADKAAQLVNFEGNYEVIVPKKAGLLINPWNKFVASGINPQTKNHLMIINQEWFSTVPKNQQDFLLTRAFVMFKEGFTPLSVKVAIPFSFFLFGIILIFGILQLLRRTPLANQRSWVRIVVSIGIAAIFNVMITTPVSTKLTVYCASLHDMKINELVVQKTGDREAAVKALEHIDRVIKAELKDGETFWTPYATTFENYAQALKK